MAQAVTWIGTGLLVGWLVRTAMKGERDHGLAGDLVTGALGAVVSGWLVRVFDLVTPSDLAAHLAVAVIGAGLSLLSVRTFRTLLHAFLMAPTPGAQPGDPNHLFDQQLTFGQRVADRVAIFGGSWAFIGIFLTAMFAWMAINGDLQQPFDPYPYILLNLILSCVAALQAPVIMMSQNRQNARDRIDARCDYDVNVRAEVQIVALHAKLDAAREQEWARLADLLITQNDRLQRIEARLTNERIR